MDLASLLGLLGCLGMILFAMVMGGDPMAYVDVTSILIVFGGTFFAVMYTAPLPVFLGSFGVMAKAFLPPIKKQEALVERMIELAGIARKDGMMALEGQEVPDKFFEKGLQMLVDGADEAKLTTQLKQEIKAMKGRHENNQNVVKAWIDIGPFKLQPAEFSKFATALFMSAYLGNINSLKKTEESSVEDIGKRLSRFIRGKKVFSLSLR